MEMISFLKNDFLKIFGMYSLLKLGYDNLGFGRYYTFYLLKGIPTIKEKIDEKKKIKG